MEKVTDYFKKQDDFRTKVFATRKGKKLVEKKVHANVAAVFQKRAKEGFKGYIANSLRDESPPPGVWAFGPSGETSRICGYFWPDDVERERFVICGAWKGKSGSGSDRPHEAEAIVELTGEIKTAGVIFPEAPPNEI